MEQNGIYPSRKVEAASESLSTQFSLGFIPFEFNKQCVIRQDVDKDQKVEEAAAIQQTSNHLGSLFPLLAVHTRMPPYRAGFSAGGARCECNIS